MRENTGGKIWEAVLFVVMVAMEGCAIGLTILAKTLVTYGMNPFVFVFYTNALSSFFLFPFSFICHSSSNRDEELLFTFPLLLCFLLLGLTGICLSQNLAFLGLSYSSPIVVCAMGLLIPAFSFLLSMILRTTKFEWRSSSYLTKVIGTVISLIGATIVELYKGPLVSNDSSSDFKHKLFFIFTSATEDWLLGGICLVLLLFVSQFGVSSRVIKQYPHVMKVASIYSLPGTILCAVVSLFLARNSSTWKLKLNFELLLIVVTAIFSGVIRSRVHIWCLEMKGPYYVPMFKPFGIVFATIFGVSFFADSFHYGSVIGSVVTGIGYYTVMWGQFNEDEAKEDHSYETISSSGNEVPLLQEEDNV